MAESTGTAEIYEDAEGQWRYRIKAFNGEIIAASEAYTRQADAVRAVLDLAAVMADVRIVTK